MLIEKIKRTVTLPW